MSADVILYVGMLVMAGAMGAIIVLLVLMRHNLDQARVDRILAGTNEPTWRTKTTTTTIEPEKKAKAKKKEEAAVPMDPDNPPVSRVFSPRVDRDPRSYPVCNCHDRRLTPGDEILWWPLPANEGVMIFHQDYIHAKAQDAV